ncbi:MAG: peptide chain release factor N(5)-glutamine methyltransferase [Candidatus Saccharimonadales bacterium]
MSANLPQPTPAIKSWLAESAKQLTDAGISTALLDAEVILAYALNQNRTYLHAHSEDNLDANILQQANSYLEKRIKRIPIAYIVGFKEFYGRKFHVTQDTLIPRPESESIIELLREILLPTTYHLPPTNLIDIGTGSGCLGITAKLEFPHLDVTITDISDDALKVATLNAHALQADIMALNSDLLQDYAKKADIIIANLPYVDKVWERSTETNYEPDLALFADDSGTALIKQLIDQTDTKLSAGGYLTIEADPVQHPDLIEYAKQHSLQIIKQNDYALSFKSQR